MASDLDAGEPAVGVDGAPATGFAGKWCATEYREVIDDTTHRPSRSSAELARAVDRGHGVRAALRHLDGRSREPGAATVAEALARFLVARCDSHHAGWRVVRQVVVDSAADAPWERCARRAVPVLAGDLLNLSGDGRRTQLAGAQHLAAQRRAEQIANHVDQSAVLADLGLKSDRLTAEQWQSALRSAVTARSREQVARAVSSSIDASSGADHQQVAASD